MKIVFRRISETEQPRPHELAVLPIDAAVQRRHCAELAIERGAAAFRQGAGPIEAIVVGADPTLDEMLAVAICEAQLAGRELPAGLSRFARYAALVREGLSPGKAPLEVSLEGIFLAIRNGAGADLTDPAVAEQFAARWSCMAAAIWRAATANVDPLKDSIFADDSEFARERTFLANDRSVYRQDVLRGEQWHVDLPGGDEGSASTSGQALLLREPRSLLFKQWSRSEQDAHAAGAIRAGQPFLLLAVAWGKAEWVFSTDPVQRLSLKSLAERLQAAEMALALKRADAPVQAEPWFDGKPFGHTLVSTPPGGTRLPEARMLAIVREWCHARPVGRKGAWRAILASGSPNRRRWAAVGAVATAVALIVGLFVFHDHRNAEESRGLQFLRIAPDSIHDKLAPRTGKDYALLFATDKFDHWPPLSNAKGDARAIGQLLQSQYGFVEPDRAFDLDREQVLAKLRSYAADKHFGENDQLFIYFAGHGDYDPATKEGFIVPKDAVSPDADPVLRTSRSIPLSQLKDKIEKLACNHVFVVLDICFGGTIEFGVATQSGMRGGGVGEPVDVPKMEFIARKMKHKCRRYLASVGKEQTPDGPLQGHSPFAARLIDSLEQDAREDGVVTIGKILSRVERGSQETRNGAMLGHEQGGDFLFVHR